MINKKFWLVFRSVKFLFSVEEQSIIGGLKDGLESVLIEKFPKFLTKIAIEDSF